MYNVLTDFHHAGLLNSLILLFEKRLGGNIYRPIGMEWAEKGFWKVYNHPATQAQFLGIGAATPDGTPPLNEVQGIGANINGTLGKRYEYYRCHDISSDEENKALLFQDFLQAPIDIVIASIPQHIEPFQQLCLLHPNKPKFIFQIGNQWNATGYDRIVPMNVMASAKIPFHQVHQCDSFIEYHQEFDTSVFNPWKNGVEENGFEDTWNKSVTSFVNCFDVDQLFAQDWHLFEEVEDMMSQWTFKTYGGQCRDGSVGPASEVANTMKASQFIWHTKNGGDGYGHVLHSSAACGRPLIIKRQYYLGKMGDALIKDGETAIVIDALSPQEIVNKIDYYSEKQRWLRMCHNVIDNFAEHVDFDKEQTQIEQFLVSLL